MNLIELQRALRQLRLGGMATVLETRLCQAQSEAMAPIDLISCLISDELTRRGARVIIIPLDDQREERIETVILRLQPAALYNVGYPGRAGAIIARRAAIRRRAQ